MQRTKDVKIGESEEEMQDQQRWCDSLGEGERRCLLIPAALPTALSRRPRVDFSFVRGGSSELEGRRKGGREGGRERGGGQGSHGIALLYALNCALSQETPLW